MHKTFILEPLLLPQFSTHPNTPFVYCCCRWWCRDHRAHHKYSDTEKDPYGIQQGFWYAHIGWMLVKQDKHKIGRSDISDLNADPIIRWQHRNYLWLAALTSFVAPCLIAGLGWGDYRVGGE